MASLYDLSARTIDGQDQSLAGYRGKALLIVNVASRCGLTPHYTGLEKLHQARANDGLVVMGFPCNQFGGQEPGSESDIKSFCESKYDVHFPLFAKLDVNGEKRHPLYQHLTAHKTAPVGPGDISWNFEKFVVDRNGNIVARFAPPTKPDAPELMAAIERALAS